MNGSSARVWANLCSSGVLLAYSDFSTSQMTFWAPDSQCQVSQFKHVDIYFPPYKKHKSGTQRGQARLDLGTMSHSQREAEPPGPARSWHIIQ